MSEKYILELKNVTKKFPGVLALDNVSFKVREGSILSIVGENGAGKSTLLKVISGVIPHSKYDGNIIFDGKITEFTSIKSSENEGIAIIHQELSISPHLSIFENLFLGNLKNTVGIVNWNRMLVEAKYYMRKVGLQKDPLELAGQLTVAEQQLLEIAKALAKKTKLLILDEPTSSLNDRDAYVLLDIMKRLRDEQGVTCIFVSHKLKEVAYVADDITVIRDGQHISDYNNKVEKINEARLIKDIVGRELSSKFPPKSKRQIGKTVLEVRDITVEHPNVKGKISVNNASFDVKAGEVVGISGLVGSGRSELAMNIFGNSWGIRHGGSIFLDGNYKNLRSVKSAIKNGFMYASEDRKTAGLIQMFSIKENIAMASSHLYSTLGILNREKETQNARVMKSKLRIKVPDIDYNVETLSGGNQQKVLLAKSLTTKFNVIIIDEPTKGIDVGSKYEIYQIVQELAAEGKAVIIISSEIEELLGTTDRIFVMSQGKIKGQIDTSQATPEKIMEIALGSQKPNRKVE